MKRKALKIKLLFILFTISCLSAFSQTVNPKVKDLWFPALKAETDGDNWTTTSWDDLLGRTSTPFFKKGVNATAYQHELPVQRGVRYTSLKIVDLSNNNLVGTIDNNDQGTWTYLNPRASNREEGRFDPETSFRFSHNKLTSVRAKLAYSSGKAKDLWFDHNLLTSFEPIPQVVAGTGVRGARNSVRINNNQLKGIPASWTGSNRDGGGLPFANEGIKEFRAENNFFNFADLIKLRSLIRKKQNTSVGCDRCGDRLPNGAPYFILGIAPQNPLGEENTPQTAAKGDVVALAFDKTHTPHGNNVYGWELNGEQTALSGNEINVTVNTASAGVYRCKITNSGLEDVVLYSRDFPVFMTKTGNTDPTDLTLDNTSSPAKTPANAIVGMFSGTDADSDDLYFRLYEILGDNSSFRIIDGNTLVSSTTLFEYSYQNSYTIKVEAYDIYGGTFQKEITITRGAVITGAFPTNIKLSNTTIAENIVAKVGDIQLVGVADATGFTYELADVKDNAFFEVKEAAIHVKAGKWLDFERKRSYTIRLKAINPDSFSITKDLIVTAEDRNDFPSGVFITNTQVGIGKQAGTFIGTLFAADDDAENTEFTFQTNSDFFTIERKINVITKRPFIASDAGVKDFSVLITDPHGAAKTFLLRIEITATPSATPVSQGSRTVVATPNNAPSRLHLFGRLVASLDRVYVEQCFGEKTYDLNSYFKDKDGDQLYYSITSDSETTIYASLQGRNTLLLQETPVTSSAIATGVTVTILVKDDKGGESTHVVKFKVVANTTDEHCVCNRE